MQMPNTVSSVVVNINGTNYTLDTADGTTFTKSINAPDASSFPLTGHYYPVSVVATYATGTSTTIDDTTQGSLGQACRLVVHETYRPTVSITSPSSGAYLTSATQNVQFSILDNANGQSSGFSGIDTSTLSITIASVKLQQSTTLHYSDVSATSITGGYNIQFTHTFDDSDDWVITVNVSDNDGNAAIATSVSFIIDTDAPELSVSSPIDNLQTSNSTITISGTTEDENDPVTISVTVDGGSPTNIPVNQDGTFSGTITLSTTGSHTIVVTAKDQAQNTTSVTRTVFYSDAAPVIQSVTMVPNPVDGGQTYVISVVVV